MGGGKGAAEALAEAILLADEEVKTRRAARQVRIRLDRPGKLMRPVALQIADGQPAAQKDVRLDPIRADETDRAVNEGGIGIPARDMGCRKPAFERRAILRQQRAHGEGVAERRIGARQNHAGNMQP